MCMRYYTLGPSKNGKREIVKGSDRTFMIKVRIAGRCNYGTENSNCYFRMKQQSF